MTCALFAPTYLFIHDFACRVCIFACPDRVEHVALDVCFKMEMCPDHYCAVHTTLLLQSAIIIRRNVKKSKTQGKIKCRLDTVPKHDAMVANGESGSKAS